ncbi:MAG: hypothetical protein ACLTG0_08230 [Oscillibacter sp.]
MGLPSSAAFGPLEQPGVAEAPATDHGHVRFGVLENADRDPPVSQISPLAITGMDTASSTA